MGISKADLYNNLANSLEAGISVPKAMTLAVRALRGKPRRVMEEAVLAIEAGHNLFEAFNQNRPFFGTADLMIIHAGELTGHLVDSFRQLSEWYEFKTGLKKRIIKQLVYPVFLVVFASGLLNLNLLVAPGGADYDAFFTNAAVFCLYIFCPVAFIFLLYKLGTVDNPLRRFVDTLFANMPYVGKAVRQLSLARYCQSFYAMFRSGVPILQALNYSARTCGNSVMAKQLEQVYQKVADGGAISEGIPEKFPPDFRAAIEVGEASGHIEETFARLSRLQMKEATHRFDIVADIVPKIFYVGILIVVAIKVINFWMNYYNDMLSAI